GFTDHEGKDRPYTNHFSSQHDRFNDTIQCLQSMAQKAVHMMNKRNQIMEDHYVISTPPTSSLKLNLLLPSAAHYREKQEGEGKRRRKSCWKQRGKLSLVRFIFQPSTLDKMVQADRILVRDAPEPCPVHVRERWERSGW
ncbi:SET domain-containing protein, partial [Clarias magur]